MASEEVYVYVVYQCGDHHKENFTSIIGIFKSRESAWQKLKDSVDLFVKDKHNELDVDWYEDEAHVNNDNNYEVFLILQMPLLS